ncbi:MAG: hypothetical protein FJW35_17455, partial [Acidobacteria bacterium]|nr:hypothetical protein [Acidobacteriota bacterium]
MNKALLPAILWLAACGSPSLAQSRSPGQALPAWELVQQGKIAEAVKVARKSPDGATTALRQLMEASDLHVTNRKIEEAVATLAAAAKFADAYDKAAKTQTPRAALQGRQLRLQGIQESDRQDYADAEATLKKA